jgi:hypothetical protein
MSQQGRKTTGEILPKTVVLFAYLPPPPTTAANR